MKDIIERLNGLMLDHNICEDDSHYSCPASGNCTDDFYIDDDLFAKDHCTCGAKQHNDELKNIIKDLGDI